MSWKNERVLPLHSHNRPQAYDSEEEDMEPKMCGWACSAIA